MNQGWLYVLMSLALLVAGCADMLGPLRSAWNATNAGAAVTIEKIEAQHQAELDAVTSNGTLTRDEKLAELDKIEARWAPAYDAYRKLRAVLATTRAALVAAEGGKKLSAARMEKLVQELTTAKDAVESAIP